MRLRPRFRTRHLLVLMTVVALLLSFVMYRVRQFEDKRAALTRLEALCDEFTETRWQSFISAVGVLRKSSPTTFSEFVTGEFPSLDPELIWIDIPNDGKNRASIRTVLERLSDFPTIEAVDINGDSIFDADVEILVRSCPELTRLEIYSPNLSDASFLSIAKLKRLQYLSITSPMITGNGLHEITHSCKALKELELRGTGITDAGLAEISECPSLKWLDIRHSKISSVGLRSLHPDKLSKLQILLIDGTEKRCRDGEIPDYQAAVSELKSRWPNAEIE